MAKPAEIYKLIERLCVSIAGETHKKDVQKTALSALGGSNVSLARKYDQNIVQRIYSKLQARSKDDASEFLTIYKNLLEFMEEDGAKNILTFLLLMADGGENEADFVNGNVLGEVFAVPGKVSGGQKMIPVLREQALSGFETKHKRVVGEFCQGVLREGEILIFVPLQRKRTPQPRWKTASKVAKVP